MSESRSPGAGAWIEPIPNMRELGGWPTGDGRRVHSGLLFRSTELSQLSADAVATLTGLGIRTVYDLRTEPERTTQPDTDIEGIENVVLDVLADATGASPAHTMELLSDPEAAQEELGGGKGEQGFVAGYRQFVSLPSALVAYGHLFSDLLQPQHRPALFHCTTGKDRTGWAAAAALLLFGVDEQDVMEEYLLTNELLLPAVQPVFDRFEAAGGDPALLRPLLGVLPQYLEASLDEMRTRFGTIEDYFSDGLGLDGEAQAALRATFTA
jgi:protein-tyrosine phosphatase